MGDSLERLGSESASGLESTMKEELCMEIDPPFRESVATAEDWRKALNKVVPAVVVLRTTACRAFDTESAGASYATGFVVDKSRGIILTNRHVVKPGNGCFFHRLGLRCLGLVGMMREGDVMCDAFCRACGG